MNTTSDKAWEATSHLNFVDVCPKTRILSEVKWPALGGWDGGEVVESRLISYIAFVCSELSMDLQCNRYSIKHQYRSDVRRKITSI